MHVERIQFLSSEFEIRTNSFELLDRLTYIAPRAQQELPISHPCKIVVTWDGEEFSISRSDGGEDRESSVTTATDCLFKRMHRTALANLPDHIGLRAVTANQDGKAFLIVGPRCSGKTTLAVSLLLAGYDVSGDELCLVHDCQAVAFPRKFLMHGDCVELLPGLKEFTDAAAHPDRETLIAVDPIGLGRSWRLVPQEVSAFFLLEPNFGARTTIQSCGKLEMLRQIIPQCTPPSSKRANWIADMSCTVDNTRTFMLRLGAMDSAVLAMKEILGCPQPLANRAEY
jgi:hypothetical protein